MSNDSEIYDLVRDCGVLVRELLELAIAKQRAGAEQRNRENEQMRRDALEVEYREFLDAEPATQVSALEPEQLIIINEPRQSYRDEIAAKYAGDYEQLQSSRAAYNAAEFERINRSLSDYRARHPLVRAVEPLPAEMHTCASDVLMTEPEARRQAEWNLLYGSCDTA